MPSSNLQLKLMGLSSMAIFLIDYIDDRFDP